MTNNFDLETSASISKDIQAHQCLNSLEKLYFEHVNLNADVFICCKHLVDLIENPENYSKKEKDITICLAKEAILKMEEFLHRK